MISCVDPFSPKLDLESGNDGTGISDQKTIDGVFQNFQPVRADARPERAFEYPLLRISEKQGLRYGAELLDEAPLVVIGILKFIEDHQREEPCHP